MDRTLKFGRQMVDDASMKVTEAVDPVTEETQLAAAERVRQSIGGARRPFERLTRLAAGQLNTPMAGITLVGPAGTTLLALTGFSLVKDEELIHRLCRSCLQSAEPMEVADASALAEGASIRSFAGVRISDLDGHPVGALWVADRVPRTTTADRLQLLVDLASDVQEVIALHGWPVDDPQTGLFNRAYLLDMIEHESGWCGREGLAVSLLVIEVDRADGAGLPDGAPEVKAFRRAVGAALAENVWRLADVAARLEDDRFGVLLSGTDEAGASLVAQRLFEAIDALALKDPCGAGCQATISVGSATAKGRVDGEVFVAAGLGALEEAQAFGGACHVGHRLGEQAELGS